MKPETTHVINAARARFGFLYSTDIEALTDDPETRLMQLLVRCGGCRFVAAAQDVPHLIHCIQTGGDYVRDVSIPANPHNERGL
jgi:hypothetical protein